MMLVVLLAVHATHLSRIARSASDVTTQTRLADKQAENEDDFPKTLSKAAGIPKTLS